ncbi:primosomal protein N' [Caproicibacterium lactatifermentans]|uniref:Replication restart protein PriA n=2 Tax=Oscillospiraceae TaxID=216572 RepID=A0ABX6PXV5_9FIRM|nr:primosomal protein N' [Caproicibacterium lactatifermentans]
MRQMQVVKVAVEKTVYHFDKDFDYAVPDSLTGQAVPGCRVLVPFGAGSRLRQGMILSSAEELDSGKKLKYIRAVLDEAPLLSHEMLFLVPWLKQRCFCTLFEAVRLLLPVGLTYQLRRFYTLAPDVRPAEVQRLLPDEQIVVAQLANHAAVERKKLLKCAGLPPDSNVPDRLCEAGILSCTRNPVRRMGDAFKKMVRLCAELPQQFRLTPRQKEVFKVLQDVGCASVKEICYFTGVTPVVIENMEAHGVCETYEQEQYRIPYSKNGIAAGEQTPIHLSPAQETAFTHLYQLSCKGDASAALLYGVTGSGKTSVYLCLIDKALEAGRTALLMVPEISLTPQMVRIFRQRYGKKMAVFHSGLSVGERMDEWKRVRRGEATVVVGTRSAVFAPLDHIGLIVVDEEQESAYQSESSPRYHAKEVAWFRCRYHHALLLLTSATPSVETYYAAKTGKIDLEILPERYGPAQMPEVHVCDMNAELQNGNVSILSRPLLEAVQETLCDGQQAILLLNRRGYHTFVVCPDCGHVMTCPNCSISLTYHAANHRLMCHYCGYSVPMTMECPACHGTHLQYRGSGTQKAEEELKKLLPQARVLRMDADAAMSRYAYEDKLHAFANGKYNLMIGTQMVAKGLDFENVTVVGVLNADGSLYNDDFRSSERTFDLLTQVVGRAGRGRLHGRAYLQTYTPENPVFALAAKQDYPAFYEQELPLRKWMLYPPFADLCVVGFVGSEEARVRGGSSIFLQMLRKLAASEYGKLPLRVLRPSPARIVRMDGRYRYKLLIKCRNSLLFRKMIACLLVAFSKRKDTKGVTAFADINPDSIL